MSHVEQVRVASIHASGLRGLPASFAAIEVSQMGLLVYGPNGSGKSSVVDSIEVAVGKVPSSFPVSTMGVKWTACKGHILAKESPRVTITLRCGGEDVAIEGTEAIESVDEKVRSWLSTARRSSFVLRRRMLLDFINAKPSDRYQLISPFVEIDKFEEVEKKAREVLQKLQVVSRGLELEFDSVSKGIDDLMMQMLQGGTGSKRETLEYVNSELASIDKPPIESLASLGEMVKEIQKDIRQSPLAEQLEKVHSLRVLLKQLSESDISSRLTRALDATALLEEVTDWRAKLAMSKVLESGKEILTDLRPSNCPLCEQKIEVEQLLHRIGERETATKTVRALHDRALESAQVLGAELSSYGRLVSEIIASWVPAAGSSLPGILHDKRRRFFGDSRAATFGHLPLAFLTELKGYILSETEIAVLFEEANKVADSLGGTERAQRLARALASVAFLERNTKLQVSLTLQRQHADVALRNAQKIVDAAETARKQSVQEQFDLISGKANSYFDSIHPAEEIGGSRLEVRDKVTASVEINAHFHGKEADPRNYFSESHLDTLGLCYFLSLRRREADLNPDFKLLVLDDVLHSVDADHRRRIASLISTSFEDHQLVITTHDSVWFEYLKNVFPADGMGRLKFTNWSLSSGPSGSDFPGLLEIVVNQEARRNLSESVVCFAVGVSAEMVCRRVASSLRFSIPFTERPTLADLWKPLKSQLAKRQSFKSEHESLLTAIDQDIWFRNHAGAHYYEDEAPITHAQATELANNFAKLYLALWCTKCRNYVMKMPNEDWQCSCRNLAYSK